MPHLDLDGTRIFFTDEGAGPVTLVLIHGLSADSNDWNWTIPLLRDRYRVVALDLRGHGHSGTGPGYALADLAGDVLALTDRIGVEQFVPVGHSLGGAITAHLAVEHPERVQAAVEVDPAYALPPVIVGFWEAGRAWWRAVQAGEPSSPPPQPPTSPVTPPFLATLIARRREAMDPAVLWATYEGLADGPERMFTASAEADAYLRRRRCPVLTIHSIPGRVQWESALFAHPASHVLEWEGSSHFLHIERYRELAAVMTGWLDALPAAPTSAPVAAEASAAP